MVSKKKDAGEMFRGLLEIGAKAAVRAAGKDLVDKGLVTDDESDRVVGFVDALFGGDDDGPPGARGLRTKMWMRTLGVKAGDDFKTVKSAYHKLIVEHHAEKPGNDPELHAEIQDAWEQAKAYFGQT